MKMVKTTHKTVLVMSVLALLGACTGEENDGDQTRDFGQGSGDSLSALTAGIWVDPNGCDHWIVDDGIEGYLSPRLDRHGRPVCSGVAPPGYAVGPYKDGQEVNDPI